MKECKVEGCSNKAINSHTVQKSKLKQISDNGMIYALDANNSSRGYSFERKGIKQASTDKIFCREHDKKIFADIEDRELKNLTIKQKNLFVYRTAVHILAKQENERDRFIKTAQEISNNRLAMEKILNNDYAFAKECNIEILSRYLNTLLNNIEDDKILYHRVFVCDDSLDVACCTISDVEIDWEGNVVSDVKKIISENLDDVPIFLNIIPDNDRTYIILSCFKEFESKVQFVDRVFKLDLPDFEKIINQMLVNDAQNVYVSEEVYKSININSEYLQHKLAERESLNLFGAMFGEPIPDFDLELDTLRVIKLL